MQLATPLLAYEDANGLVATWRDVVIVVIHREVSIALLQASVDANRALASRYPEGLGALSLGRAGVSLPPADVRRAAAEAIAAVHDNVRCAAQVLCGDGFWASAARSVVTAMELLRPDDRPRRTFGRIEEGTHWMAGIMGGGVVWSAELANVARTYLTQAPSTRPSSSIAG